MIFWRSSHSRFGLDVQFLNCPKWGNLTLFRFSTNKYPCQSCISVAHGERPCTIVAKCAEDLYYDELYVSGPESLDRLPRAAVDAPFDEMTGLHQVLRSRIRHDSKAVEDSLHDHRKSPRLDASSGRRNQVSACSCTNKVRTLHCETESPVANVSMLQAPLHASPRRVLVGGFNGGSIQDAVRYPAQRLFLVW